MRTNLTAFQNAIKDVALGTSKFETALAATEVLSDLYDTLATKFTELKNAKSGKTNGNLDAVDKSYYEADINAVIDAINNTLAVEFEGVGLMKTHYDTGKNGSSGDPDPSLPDMGTYEITVNVSGFSDSKVTTTNYFELKKINTVNSGDKTKITLDTGTTSPTTVEFYFDEDKIETSPSSNIYNRHRGLITEAKANKTRADNNYRLILAGITNLANFDTLARVQKTNTEAAISALEDIDIQEEMINLMQSQILEELSSEALLKIKDSSKYIVNLIRG